MQVSAFDFALPKDLIAQRPASPRDSARLLLVDRERLSDHRVSDLPALLTPGDLLVFNDTRVLPARLLGRRGDAGVEVTLHKPAADGGWWAFARPARKCRIGDRLDFAETLAADVVDRRGRGEVALRFSCKGDALIKQLKRHGRMPLPPYIKRSRTRDAADDLDYQTVFARRDGAVAAPTAALHFTSDLLRALADRGVDHAFVTLHVGAGTFLPVRSATTEGHHMHSERFELAAPTVSAIDHARRRGGRIVAVGTTVLRTLEAVAAAHGRLRPTSGETDLFVTPGYRFQVVDRLLTNFHLPCSTLFMLVAAFSGLARMQTAYRHAVDRGYRFFSYGDACLLTPDRSARTEAR